MRFNLRAAAVAAAITLATVAGCGGQLTQADPATQAAALLGYHTLGVGEDTTPPLAKELGLTADQRAMFRAIAARHRQASQHADVLATLQPIVGADTVDPAALTAWLDGRRAELRSHKADHLAMAGELRAVLTADQRAQLVAKLQQDPPPAGRGAKFLRAHMRGHVIGMLGLTAEQKARFDALTAKLAALRTPERTRAIRGAIAAFVQDGNQQALGAALDAQLPGELPEQELVAFVSSLSKDQRTRLLAQAAKFHHHG